MSKKERILEFIESCIARGHRVLVVDDHYSSWLEIVALDLCTWERERVWRDRDEDDPEKFYAVAKPFRNEYRLARSMGAKVKHVAETQKCSITKVYILYPVVEDFGLFWKNVEKQEG